MQCNIIFVLYDVLETVHCMWCNLITSGVWCIINLTLHVVYHTPHFAYGGDASSYIVFGVHCVVSQ